MSPYKHLNQILVLVSIIFLFESLNPSRLFAQNIEWKLFNSVNTMFPALTINDIVIDKVGNIWIASVGKGIVKLEGKIWTLLDQENSGLPDNYVYALSFDKNNNLWVGSASGLMKYDGNKWEEFNGYRSFLEIQNHIEDIAVDDKDNIWVGVGQDSGGGGGGLFKFDGENWTSYNSQNSILPDYLIVTSIETDRDSSIWFGTQIGLFKYDGKSWTKYDQSNSSIPSNFVASLSIDRYGNKWVGTYENGVAKFDGTNWVVYHNQNSMLPDNHVSSVDVDSEGNIWIGTYNGLAKIINDDWEIYNTENSLLPDNIVRSVKIDIDNNVWIGTDSGGLAKFENGNWTILNQQTPNYLPDDHIFDIKIDKSGLIWIATYNGLAKFDGIFWTVYNKENSQIPSNKIYVIEVDDFNNKWIGTEGGLTKFDGEHFVNFNTSNSGLPIYNSVHNLAIDLKGNLWLSTSPSEFASNPGEGSGLTKFDGTNWITYTSENSGLLCNYISCITVDKIGDVWAGTGLNDYNCEGLVQFDGEKWTVFNTDNSLVPSDNIISIAVDKQNNKWIAASPSRKAYGLPLFDGGLSKFDGSNWTTYNKDNSQLSSNEITALSVDSDNNIWIGGTGLQFFDGESWKLFDMENFPLPSNIIRTIFNYYGNTWIGTFPQFIGNGKYSQGGIAVYNPIGVVLNIEENKHRSENNSIYLSNYPNPFNSTTVITFRIQQYGLVTIKIYDVLGREITTLLKEIKQPGDYKVEFTGSKLSSGIYFCHLQVGNNSIIKKMLFIK